MNKFKVGEIVKIIEVGAMFSSHLKLAAKLNATQWELRTPFNRKLEGELAIIKTVEDVDKTVEDVDYDPRYLIELKNGDQYIINKRGITKTKEIFKMLPDKLFEI